MTEGSSGRQAAYRVLLDHAERLEKEAGELRALAHWAKNLEPMSNEELGLWLLACRLR